MRGTWPYLAVAVLLAGCSTPVGIPESTSRGAARFDLWVLGRAQDGGLPHLGCEKPCCTEARAAGRTEFPACLGIHDRRTGRLVLVEATPAIEAQVAMLHGLAGATGRARRPVDALLLTHAHVGHYLGLAQFGREVASTSRLPVFVTPSMASFLRSNGPWSQLVAIDQVDLREVAPVDPGVGGGTCEPIEGLRVEVLRVPHRDEFSDTVAFRFHGPARTVLFVPDVDRWEAHGGLLERLLEGVDVAYIDGTFFDGSELPGRDLSEIPHPPIVDTMERLASFAREHPGAVRFLHLNHTNPALVDPVVRRSIEASGFAIAVPGERVGL